MGGFPKIRVPVGKVLVTLVGIRAVYSCILLCFPAHQVAERQLKGFRPCKTWVVVKTMVPFGIPIIIRHLIFRVPKKGP